MWQLHVVQVIWYWELPLPRFAFMKINEEILNETLAHLILVERGALSILI